ncbi:Lysophosphatidylcholine acyltransferase 2 [Desmophyllum pertusum]|uniref:Lysophosphatidylcholine acyltransferase 2 n=1 Tax=Desmophyllum pertusum TaxID=174260 RepID=A0A9W9YP67_9CNID|nr:Lysophosphatidylcholine acyltransferase 2 [Desmophyllum pertusum]
MLPVIEAEVKRFYSELSIAQPAVRNPFIHRVEITSYKKKLEIFVGFIFLLPIRLLASILLFIFAGIWCFIITVGWNPPDLRTPLSPWRRWMKGYVPFIVRTMLFAMGFHKIKIKGKLAPSSEAPVTVVAPHSSFLDILLLCEYGSAPSGISKMENLKSPVLGGFFQCLETIGVSRDDTKSRQTAVKELQYRAITTRGQWPHICIFPEGTCTNRKSLISFKPGAFIPGCPVQPVCLHFPDLYSWTWDGPGVLSLAVLLMCQVNNEAEVEFLPVWNPTDEEKENPKLYAEHVQKFMARCLNLPVTGHSFEDTLLMAAAIKRGLPPQVGIIEFKATAAKLGVNLDTVKEHLDKFVALDSDKDGHISLKDFALYYKLPTSSAVKELFSIFDRENKDVIDFREYLLGSVCLARLAAKKEVAERALKALQEYSKPNQSLISDSKQEGILMSILKNIDETYSDNHNVRSRNEEFQDFLSHHDDLTVLLSSLLPTVENHVRESILI